MKASLSPTPSQIDQLSPWAQLAFLRDRQRESRVSHVHMPRLILRGRREHLRALRAAEMAAWEAAGAKSASKPPGA
ncbi:MAG TPA: hypothetical protein VNO52_17005 [Methylomirabilota bacterium]|nr:hypothetical protein [Methylomirabilota bacterium]